MVLVVLPICTEQQAMAELHQMQHGTGKERGGLL